jgi:hypothetical protein
MTPADEVKRLNKLIHQYETVYKTTPDADQRERALQQLKEFRSYRDKILAVNVIDAEDLAEAPVETDELAETPVLRQLVEQNDELRPGQAVAPFAYANAQPTTAQQEMFNLALYARHFEKEYLPFLTEKRLKLDFKFSLDRDGFYNGFQALQRGLENYREEVRRLSEGTASRDMEKEMRKRAIKVTRQVAIEGARFFRSIERFASELSEDARGDGVKCLNADTVISFDKIEGARLLEGRQVADALDEMRDFAREAIAYLNIPEIEIQENERADRH